MRAIWTGAISFGLVNIPVRLYSAAEDRELKFHLLHAKNFAPIRYARISKATGEEVPYEEIVKGYEYQKGDYVVMSDEDFKKADVRKTKTIDIQAFVDEQEIDPIYFAKPYYLEPDKGAAKPYALLREALAQSKKVAVASFVLRNREHLAVLKPVGNVIVLDQLRYASEIRPSEDLEVPAAAEAPKKEVNMALKLVEQLTEHFNPKAFKDTYTSELKQMIEKKARGKTVRVKGEEPEPTRVPDLMAVLEKSLRQAHHR
ncbi:MAG TPA: Ku protein [Patescibacteria group bacterium]|nr:Ku protein [Patescibacteria group bacterium]